MSDQAQLESHSAVCCRRWENSWMKKHYVKNSTFGKKELCEQTLMLNKNPTQPTNQNVKRESRHSWRAADSPGRDGWIEPPCYMNSKLCCCNWYSQCARQQWKGVFLSRVLPEMEIEQWISVAIHVVFSNYTFCPMICVWLLFLISMESSFRNIFIPVLMQSDGGASTALLWFRWQRHNCRRDKSSWLSWPLTVAFGLWTWCWLAESRQKGANKTWPKILWETSAPSLTAFLSKAMEKRFHVSASACPDAEQRCEKYFVQ